MSKESDLAASIGKQMKECEGLMALLAKVGAQCQDLRKNMEEQRQAISVVEKDITGGAKLTDELQKQVHGDKRFQAAAKTYQANAKTLESAIKTFEEAQTHLKPAAAGLSASCGKLEKMMADRKGDKSYTKLLADAAKLIALCNKPRSASVGRPVTAKNVV